MLKHKEYKETFFDSYVWANFIPKEHKYVKIKGQKIKILKGMILLILAFFSLCALSNI